MAAELNYKPNCYGELEKVLIGDLVVFNDSMWIISGVGSEGLCGRVRLMGWANGNLRRKKAKYPHPRDLELIARASSFTSSNIESHQFEDDVAKYLGEIRKTKVAMKDVTQPLKLVEIEGMNVLFINTDLKVGLSHIDEIRDTVDKIDLSSSELTNIDIIVVEDIVRVLSKLGNRDLIVDISYNNLTDLSVDCIKRMLDADYTSYVIVSGMSLHTNGKSVWLNTLTPNQMSKLIWLAEWWIDNPSAWHSLVDNPEHRTLISESHHSFYE